MKQPTTIIKKEKLALANSIERYMMHAIENSNYPVAIRKITDRIKEFFDCDEKLQHTEYVRQQFIRLIVGQCGKIKPIILQVTVGVLERLFNQAAIVQPILYVFIRSFRSKHFYDRMTDIIRAISFKYMVPFEHQFDKLIKLMDRTELNIGNLGVYELITGDNHLHDEATKLVESIPIQHTTSTQPLSSLSPQLIQQKTQTNSTTVQIFDNPTILISDKICK